MSTDISGMGIHLNDQPNAATTAPPDDGLMKAVTITKTEDGGMNIHIALQADVVLPGSLFEQGERERLMGVNVVAQIIAERLQFDIDTDLVPAIDSKFREAIMGSVGTSDS